MKDNHPKTRFIYEKISLIGEGSYGKAFLVRCKQNSSINLNDYDKKQKEDALIEAKILNSLNHPNIIKFNEVFIAQKPTCTLNIVTEYAEGGDLSHRIRLQNKYPFKENQILDWVIQISLALHEIHSKKILHRDIKPANCFLSKNDMIKIGDFGISKPLVNTMEMANTMIGTPYFLSPEILSSHPYSYKCDIWSLGILLYELMMFKLPFEGQNIFQLQNNITKGIITSPPPNTYSKELRTLLKELLITDPNKRPSAMEILTKDLCKKRINVIFKEVNYDKALSDSLLTNIKKEKKMIKIEIINLSKSKPKPHSNKLVTQTSDVIQVDTNSDKLRISYPIDLNELNKPINSTKNINNNNTVEKKSSNLIEKEEVKDVKNKSVKAIQKKKFDFNSVFNFIKKDSQNKSQQHNNGNSNYIGLSKPKSFPVIIHNHQGTKSGQQEDNDNPTSSSPYNPKEKQLLYDSCIFFNSLYQIVNNESIDNNNDKDKNKEDSSPDITLMTSNEETPNYVEDMTESLIAFQTSKNELMKELGKELFNIAYKIINDNINLSTFNFKEVKSILKTQLRGKGYKEEDISLILSRFPGIFSIISNEKQSKTEK